MNRSTLVSVSRRALQLATLFLAAAPVAFGAEPVASDRGQLIGEMVVTATREIPLIGQMVVTATPKRPFVGHLVVTATRLAPENVVVADLGAMTVTAHRVVTFARNEAPKAQASL